MVEGFAQSRFTGQRLDDVDIQTASNALECEEIGFFVVNDQNFGHHVRFPLAARMLLKRADRY